jgi:predicted Zn finger-like uncharacterized protein
MLSFSCPSCHVKVKVKDESAGKKVRCPQCKQTIDIPTGTVTVELAGPADPPFSEDATVPPRPASHGGDATVPSVPPVPAAATVEPESCNGEAAGEKARESLKAEANYEVADEIARGGMGAIMRAVDQDIRREVAVKFLLNHADARHKARFVEEAQITGQLEHPNIVPIHQLGVHPDGRCFFSMKMVKGRSLAEILKEPHKDATLGRLLNIFVSICNAVAYAHSREVIHRDLKPANVMVGDFGEVYVMDWGLAKVLGKPEPGKPEPPVSSAPATHIQRPKPRADPTQPGSPSLSKCDDKVTTNRQTVGELTQAGAIMGTPAYMPPEQAQGDNDVDQRADIYSLGAILYEIMTLTPPVGRGGDMVAMMMRVVHGQIDPPAERAPERAKAGWIPPELAAVALKALATKRKNRYQTVEKLKQDVELFLEGRSVSAKQDTFREMFWKLVKRNKAASVAAGIALLAVMVGMLALVGGMVSTSLALVRAREAESQAREAEGHARADQKRAELAEVQAAGESKKAKEAYQAYLEQVKGSVPLLLRAAKSALGERQYDDALVQASAAAQTAPDNADARLLKGQLLITRLRFAEAAAELEEYRKLQGEDADVQKLTELCRTAQPEDVNSRLAFVEVFTQRGELALADGVTSGEGKTVLEARQRLLEIHRKRIEAAWPGQGFQLKMNKEGRYFTRLTKVTDLTPLRGMPFTSLELLGGDQIRELTPLKGMRLTWLRIAGAQVRDLSPLKGMPLTWLYLSGCKEVGDLSPLKSMPLTSLYLDSCIPVRDLEPLKGMPLKVLSIIGTGVTHLTPLQGMELDEIRLTPKNIMQGLDILRDMESLKTIGIARGQFAWPAAEFWARYDKGEFKK